MKIYIDLLFLLNAWIDFFLLLSVKFLLRRIVTLKRVLFSSLIGALTTFLIFLNINYYILIILKLIMSVIIVLIAYGYKNIVYTIKNVIYLFMMGIILGGLALYLKDNINNKTLYIALLILLTPIFLYFFYKQNNIIKKQYSLYYQVDIIIGYINQSLCGFLDSGNNLIDPVTKKPIILVSKYKLKGINRIRSPMFIPAKTINKNSLIKCYKPDRLLINQKEYKNYLIGLIDNKLFMDGIDCLLNNRLMEDLWLKNF